MAGMAAKLFEHPFDLGKSSPICSVLSLARNAPAVRRWCSYASGDQADVQSKSGYNHNRRTDRHHSPARWTVSNRHSRRKDGEGSTGYVSSFFAFITLHFRTASARRNADECLFTRLSMKKGLINRVCPHRSLALQWRTQPCFWFTRSVPLPLSPTPPRLLLLCQKRPSAREER